MPHNDIVISQTEWNRNPTIVSRIRAIDCTCIKKGQGNEESINGRRMTKTDSREHKKERRNEEKEQNIQLGRGL